MLRSILAASALMWATTSALAQDFSPGELTSRVIERRAVEAVIWGMPVVNFDLMLQAMIGSANGKPKSDRLLVASAGLEEPDAHAESRRDLPNAIFQH
jgi:hypothetical protein